VGEDSALLPSLVTLTDVYGTSTSCSPTCSTAPSTPARSSTALSASTRCPTDKDVAFVVDADPAVNDRIDAGYRSKYRRYGANIIGGVVNPESRASTIKLVPR
jgi:Uncharacterized protein conserved in bacteria (DUF2255)